MELVRIETQITFWELELGSLFFFYDANHYATRPTIMKNKNA